MASKSIRIPAARFVSLLIFMLLFAFEAYSAEEIFEPVSEDYAYELDASGNPVFSQKITWEKEPNALKFLLEILASDGTVVWKAESEEAAQTVSLPAGTYRYRITAYNLLGKPEAAGEWSEIIVKKAQIPAIKSFSPAKIFLEEENFKLTIRGTDIFPDSLVYLDDSVLGIHRYQGKVLEGSEEGRLEIQLPADTIDTGTFRITVVNPGGLKDKTEEQVRIQYLNPFEFFGTAGWAGWIPLYNSWYTELWKGPIYPLGAQSNFTWVFAKKRYGFLGIQTRIGTNVFEGGITNATIRTEYANAGISFVWKYRFNNRWFLLGSAGPGVTWTSLAFDYNGNQGPEAGSWDADVGAGLNLQYVAWNKHLLVDLGVRFDNVFYNGKNIGGLFPSLSTGWLF